MPALIPHSQRPGGLLALVVPDAAVWILSPVRLNEAFSFHSFVKRGYIPNVDEEVVDLYFGPNAEILSTTKPAAVIGHLNSSRILAQRGTFTVFPPEEDGCEVTIHFTKLTTRLQQDKTAPFIPYGTMEKY